MRVAARSREQNCSDNPRPPEGREKFSDGHRTAATIQPLLKPRGDDHERKLIRVVLLREMPFSLNPQSKNMMIKPILVVGAGPVGMTMASELAGYGVPVRIVDKAAQRTDKSKALVLWSRTLELLDRGAGADPFVNAGSRPKRSTSPQAAK